SKQYALNSGRACVSKTAGVSAARREAPARTAMARQRTARREVIALPRTAGEGGRLRQNGILSRRVGPGKRKAPGGSAEGHSRNRADARSQALRGNGRGGRSASRTLLTRHGRGPSRGTRRPTGPPAGGRDSDRTAASCRREEPSDADRLQPQTAILGMPRPPVRMAWPSASFRAEREGYLP